MSTVLSGKLTGDILTIKTSTKKHLVNPLNTKSIEAGCEWFINMAIELIMSHYTYWLVVLVVMTFNDNIFDFYLSVNI